MPGKPLAHALSLEYSCTCLIRRNLVVCTVRYSYRPGESYPAVSILVSDGDDDDGAGSNLGWSPILWAVREFLLLVYYFIQPIGWLVTVRARIEEKYAGTSEFPFSAAGGGGNKANLAHLAETKRKEYAGYLTKRGNYNVVVTFAPSYLGFCGGWLVGWVREERGGEGRGRGCGEERSGVEVEVD